MKFANGKKNADMKYLSVVLVYASCNEKSIVFWKIYNVFLPINQKSDLSVLPR